ncbi:STE20-related kinase adapter protein alpha [Lethenteron reissneri]|uniref:STE20-related kinase adapter protein alpha n=1 Tax=Lethenteron reissneri TaxID=7753 RepID=UPI002AB628C3|nr:STE20-related kinase adapter protein alpha [Lethenteron reissneri]XP_061432656.1 STE20-related kinase adapter protein alpha [Lethenteron reissneri]
MVYRTEEVRRKRTMTTSYLPERNHYQTISMLGNGFEELMSVRLARHVPSGSYVAVRHINLEGCSHELFSLLQDELHIAKLFHHSNILPYWASFVVDNELWIITPFMAYGSAKDLISAHFTDGLPEPAIALVLYEVLRGLEYVHRMGFVHRSVKASHVLVSADGRVCLTGLRSALSMILDGHRLRAVHTFPRHSVGTLPWLSPELLQQNLEGYDTKSDIYSLGIMACELANAHVPFKDMPTTQMLLEKLNGTVPCLLDTHTIPAEDLNLQNARASHGVEGGAGGGGAAGWPAASSPDQFSHPYNRTFSAPFHNFTEICLQRDPDRRPSATALMNHVFFKQVRKRQCDALPELLRPVAPLTEQEAATRAHPDNGLDGVVRGLQRMQAADDWDF